MFRSFVRSLSTLLFFEDETKKKSYKKDVQKLAKLARKLENVPYKKKRQKKRKPRAHILYQLRRTSRRQRRLSCLFCLGRKNVTTDIERDGLVVVAHERTDDLVIIIIIIIATKIARERKGKGNIAATTDDRSRCVERTKREAMSPSSLLSDSRVLLHLRDA